MEDVGRCPESLVPGTSSMQSVVGGLQDYTFLRRIAPDKLLVTREKSIRVSEL